MMVALSLKPNCRKLNGSFELQLVVFLLFNVKGWDGGIKDGLEVFS